MDHPGVLPETEPRFPLSWNFNFYLDRKIPKRVYVNKRLLARGGDMDTPIKSTPQSAAQEEPKGKRSFGKMFMNFLMMGGFIVILVLVVVVVILVEKFLK